jgi:hypothetical protein
MVIGNEILTQAWLVGGEHMVGRLRGDIALAIVAGVEQELRARNGSPLLLYCATTGSKRAN